MRLQTYYYCAAMVKCSYGPHDTGPHGTAIYAANLGANILTTSHMRDCGLTVAHILTAKATRWTGRGLEGLEEWVVWYELSACAVGS